MEQTEMTEAELTRAQADQEITEWAVAVDEFTSWLYGHIDLVVAHGLPTLVFSRYCYTSGETTDEQLKNVLGQLKPWADALKDGAPIGDVKKISNDYNYGVKRQWHPEVYAQCIAPAELTCTMVDTGEVERVEEVEVPDDVVASYTKTVLKPVMQKVCVRLSDSE